jgi:uncharacterized protein with FMN-binding domain
VLAVYAAGFVRTRDAAAAALARSAPRTRPASALAETSEVRLDAASHGPVVAEPATAELSADAPPVIQAVTPPAASASPTKPAATPPVSAPVSSIAAAAPPPVMADPQRATPPIDSAPAPAPVKGAADSAAVPAPAGWRDGTWTGWGTSRHGDIEATVLIEKGRITAAAISQCLTRYSCSWIAHLQAQVAARQSPEVDNVSGATESANAFYYAVVDALKKAR